MYCTKCGIQLKENSKFCAHRGTASTTETTAPPPVQPMPQEIGANQSNSAAVKKQPNYKLIGIIAGGGFVLLIGLIILIFVLANLVDRINSESVPGNYMEANINYETESGTNPDSVLKNYLKASVDYDLNTVLKYSAYDIDALFMEICHMRGISQKEFYEELYDEMGAKSITELFEIAAKEMKEYMQDHYANIYGSNYDITFEIIDSRPLRKSDMEDEIDSLRYWFDRRDFDFDINKVIRIDKIEEMVRYTVDMCVRGHLGEDTERNDDIIMVKIGNDWRVWENNIFDQIGF